ncbi:ejaculatory bulb-specific protein 3-like [Phlebotomus argentipes]|uniref:ejaculatory bulb-specific protein 3-like n=1 Tax=Phlebotomus argentipes TaxID=94469 RepID=UPI00289372B1|nr:ejaculatory bulb-specific protein 3-like [Phlebotomus argentipes]
MKWIVLLCLTIVTVLSASEDKYTDRYDDMDIEGILDNSRILTNYIKCLVNEGPCTPDARELKSILPEALESDCAKCTDKQRVSTQIVLNYLIENRPDAWDALENVYDFAGVYKNKYLAEKTTTISP